MVTPDNEPVTVEETTSTNGHTRGYKRFTSDGRRYKTETLTSLGGEPMRLQSLTAGEYLTIAYEGDERLLQAAIVDEDGKEEITLEDLPEFIADLDANVYCEMMYKARKFCLPLTLPGMIEEAAKN